MKPIAEEQFIDEAKETKTCESCGEEFSCGAKGGECWCFDVEFNEETLAKLREDFEKCLCNNCLRKIESKKNEIRK